MRAAPLGFDDLAPMRAMRFVAAAGALALACFWSGASHATTYKWVDERGVVQYSDRLPADAASRNTTALDKQARPMKKMEAAPPPPDPRAKQADAERKQALEREQEVAGRRDRALLQSYASEAEIDLARSRSLATIDAQIDSAQAYSKLLGKRREELAARKAASRDKSLSVADERELEGVEGELVKQRALVDLKQKERQAALARYDADKARWRELRTADATPDAPAAAANNDTPYPGAARSAPARNATPAASAAGQGKAALPKK